MELILNEFSIETLSESIYNHKTQEYFDEIISSYNNKSFRSATVMLWSVAVIDLVFKLTDLVDLHEDNSAKSILKEMSEVQSKIPAMKILKNSCLTIGLQQQFLLDT